MGSSYVVKVMVAIEAVWRKVTLTDGNSGAVAAGTGVSIGECLQLITRQIQINLQPTQQNMHALNEMEKDQVEFIKE